MIKINDITYDTYINGDWYDPYIDGEALSFDFSKSWRTAGTHKWTVPKMGKYKIELSGGAGGEYKAYFGYRLKKEQGKNGELKSGVFTLYANMEITIVVGDAGEAETNGESSFIYYTAQPQGYLISAQGGAGASGLGQWLDSSQSNENGSDTHGFCSIEWVE